MRTRNKILKIENLLFTLIYVLFIMLFLNARTISKYTGEALTDGNAVVAKWDVKVDTSITSNNISIISGTTTQDYKLQVTSESEVTCSYSIVLSNVPNDVKVAIDGGTPKTPSDNTVTFDNAGSFSINDSELTHEHTLTFSAPLEANAVTNNQINLSVMAEQIN